MVPRIIGIKCHKFCEEDPGTVVFIWPTIEIDANSISKFLSVFSEFNKTCTRMILVMEDIGGGEREGSGQIRSVDAGMLNLLDGVEVTFKLPTFILATTNYPQNLLSALADRPGRFDLMLELEPPKAKERIRLVEFIAKRKLTADEEAAIKDKRCGTFSIAHLEEIVIRSMLHDKSMKDVITELVSHKDIVARAFEKSKKDGGFGFN